MSFIHLEKVKREMPRGFAVINREAKGQPDVQVVGFQLPWSQFEEFERDIRLKKIAFSVAVDLTELVENGDVDDNDSFLAMRDGRRRGNKKPIELIDSVTDKIGGFYDEDGNHTRTLVGKVWFR